MSRLYVIGAGCSKNYEQGTSKIPDLTCPVDSDFFRMAKKYLQSPKVHEGRNWRFFDDIDHLIRDICEMYACFPETIDVFDDNRLSLESIMTAFSIRMEIFDKPIYTYGYPDQIATVASRRLYTLVELISRTITAALEGPICNKHLKLVKGMNEGDVVLSYNYDLLLDNAAREVGKLTDSGYFLSFERALEAGQWVRPQEEHSQISLFKLHGSLNWLRCSVCNCIFLLRRDKMGAWMTTLPEACPKCLATHQYLERLLIPPLLVKNYTDAAINYLWLEAQYSLNKIDEMVVIGYSLAPTDFASETLFRYAMPWQLRAKIPVTIVDPKEDAKLRFSKIFPEKNIKWVKSLDDFLKN